MCGSLGEQPPRNLKRFRALELSKQESDGASNLDEQQHVAVLDDIIRRCLIMAVLTHNREQTPPSPAVNDYRR